MKQRNCHARSRKNAAKIRAKKRHMRLMQKHIALVQALSPAQIGKKIALHVATDNESPKEKSMWRGNNKIVGHKNQRQQRKIWRQVPHMRKKAA